MDFHGFFVLSSVCIHLEQTHINLTSPLEFFLYLLSYIRQSSDSVLVLEITQLYKLHYVSLYVPAFQCSTVLIHVTWDTQCFMVSLSFISFFRITMKSLGSNISFRRTLSPVPYVLVIVSNGNSLEMGQFSDVIMSIEIAVITLLQAKC